MDELGGTVARPGFSPLGAREQPARQAGRTSEGDRRIGLEDGVGEHRAQQRERDVALKRLRPGPGDPDSPCAGTGSGNTQQAGLADPGRPPKAEDPALPRGEGVDHALDLADLRGPLDEGRVRFAGLPPNGVPNAPDLRENLRRRAKMQGSTP